MHAQLLLQEKCWDVTHEQTETYISLVKLFSREMMHSYQSSIASGQYLLESVKFANIFWKEFGD